MHHFALLNFAKFYTSVDNEFLSHTFLLGLQVLAYYISFLKTLSFKLNVHTIHFFYNEVSKSVLCGLHPNIKLNLKIGIF